MNEYEQMDALNDKWHQIEQKLANVVVQIAGFDLSCQKSNGKLRIMFMGKPITECKAEDRIKAVELLEEFVAHRHRALQDIDRKAKVANALIDQVLAKLKPKE